MKKFFLLAVVTFLYVGITSAQECKKSSKSCCMSKKTAALNDGEQSTKVASALMEADALASADENIEKRVCAHSGKVSYYEKSVCAVSGQTTWNEVEYNTDAKKFSRVASASMEKVDDMPKKACAGEAKAKDGKACCAKKEGGKSCTKKEGTK